MSTTLSDACSIIMGQAPPGESYNELGHGVPLVAGAGDFKNGVLVPKKFTNAPQKMSQSGDIILSIRASIGAKVWADGYYCLGRGVASLRPNNNLDARYLWHWLSRHEADLIAKGRGATFLQVNRNDIGEMPIPLPPLEEQRRIAAILDEADEIRTKRRAQLALLDELPQALFHEMFGDRSLEQVPLGEICTFYSGGTPSKSNDSFWSGDVPWFSAKDMKSFHLFDSEDHISSIVTEETSLRLLPAGTVAVVVRGMILARTIPIAVLCVPSTINQDLKALLPKQECNQSFLAEAFRSRTTWLRARVSTAAHGTTKLDSVILQAVPVPLVPLAEQQAFATKVETIQAERSRIATALKADDELFAALQYRAFRGEL